MVTKVKQSAIIASATLREYKLWNRQLSFVSMFFLFCWGECALELFLGAALKFWNNIKRKQTFISYESIFYLKN